MGGQGSLEDYLEIVNTFKGSDLNDLIMQILNDQTFMDKLKKQN